MALERDLVNYVADNPGLIESGMTVVGREVVIGGVRPDMLLRDRHGDPVIAEFKRGSATREAVGQLMEYVGLVAPSQPTVRGFLIAERIPASVGTALTHHGLEFRELECPTDLSVPATPFDDMTAGSPLARPSEAAISRSRPPDRRAHASEARLVPAGAAYPIYRKAAIYCCPVTMRNLQGDLPPYVAFYDKGIKREIAHLRDVFDVDVEQIGAYADRIKSAGRDPGAVQRALAEWRTWGQQRKPSGHSYSTARLALLSSATESDTILLPREIVGAVGSGQGHQSHADFHLDDLHIATTYAELKSLKRKRN